MKKKDNRPKQVASSTLSAQTLRRRADDFAREKAIQLPENPDTPSPEETRQLLHELQVHQIELEIQNEELRRAQFELETAQARYFDLYDLAPVGYFTLSEKGLILEANLTAAALLDVARETLVKQPISRFIMKEDQDIYYQHRKQLLNNGEPQMCEVRMVKKNGSLFWASLASTVAQEADGMSVYRLAIIDITKRKQAEDDLLESEKRLGFERLLSDISARFINLPVDQVDAMIEIALGQIMEFLGVDRCGLIEVSPDQTVVKISHVMSTEGFPPLPQDINLVELYPWTY